MKTNCKDKYKCGHKRIDHMFNSGTCMEKDIDGCFLCACSKFEHDKEEELTNMKKLSDNILDVNESHHGMLVIQTRYIREAIWSLKEELDILFKEEQPVDYFKEVSEDLINKIFGLPLINRIDNMFK